MIKRAACIGLFLFLIVCAARASAEIVTGSVTATTTPTAIGSGRTIEVVVQADPDNKKTDVFVGSATSQTIQLKAGQSILIREGHPLSAIFVKTNSGTAIVNFILIRP